jgi:hypothetical protein
VAAVRRFALLLPAAILLAGCGTKVDGDSIEKELMKSYGTRGYPGLRFECPDPKNEVGERFVCEMSGLEGYSRVEVEVRGNESVQVVREY